LVSGCRIFKDKYASAYTADYLAGQGYPRSLLFEFPQDAYSTVEEAGLLIQEFRSLGLDTVLVVTVNFHTARTRRIFNALAQGDPVIQVHAAPFAFYDPDAFWITREGLKAWVLEWAKTALTAWELLFIEPLETVVGAPQSLPNPRDANAKKPEKIAASVTGPEIASEELKSDSVASEPPSSSDSSATQPE
jgi:hypothetical protein